MGEKKSIWHGKENRFGGEDKARSGEESPPGVLFHRECWEKASLMRCHLNRGPYEGVREEVLCV